MNSRIANFFEKHTIVRKVIAHAPTILLGGGSLIEGFTSYKVLPKCNMPNMLAISGLCAISGIMAGYDSYLQNKKIERLN